MVLELGFRGRAVVGVWGWEWKGGTYDLGRNHFARAAPGCEKIEDFNAGGGDGVFVASHAVDRAELAWVPIECSSKKGNQSLAGARGV